MGQIMNNVILKTYEWIPPAPDALGLLRKGQFGVSFSCEERINIKGQE
jgi:hypothetical protein